ncbi:MAG: aminoglycoside phosphotransferase family protein [Actinobacteria bacterium]|nr:aminoglycoside phosphotransferase family protein [Actinomycetota bacterium]
MTVRVLEAAGLADLLVTRGVVKPGAVATELAGGVSNTVVLVDDGERRVVAKQSLPRLKVADDWQAKQERLLTEAAALRLAGVITPGLVPAVLDVDAERFVVVIEAAPAGWDTWKAALLARRVDGAVATALGRSLAAWHAATAGDRGTAAQFDDVEAFEQLRVDPYYRTVARRDPSVADAVEALIEQTLTTSACLVHGDFSPKNVLVGDGRCWVLDWEVAHVGDPTFDVAFLTSHLVLKAIHAADAAPFRDAAAAFWEAYGRHDGPRTMRHLGALLLARVVGKSPVEYLDAEGRRRASALGRSLLLDPPGSLDAVWKAAQ